MELIFFLHKNMIRLFVFLLCFFYNVSVIKKKRIADFNHTLIIKFYNCLYEYERQNLPSMEYD